MIMQDLTLNNLVGEWLCVIQNKPYLYLNIKQSGTYHLHIHPENKDITGSITLKYTERNTVDMNLERFSIIELWHISDDNEIAIKINEKVYSFKRINI